MSEWPPAGVSTVRALSTAHTAAIGGCRCPGTPASPPTSVVCSHPIARTPPPHGRSSALPDDALPHDALPHEALPHGTLAAADTHDAPPVAHDPTAHPQDALPHGALAPRTPAVLPHVALPSVLARAAPARPPNNALVSRETNPRPRCEPMFVISGRRVRRSQIGKGRVPRAVDRHRVPNGKRSYVTARTPEDIPPATTTHPTDSDQLRLLIVTTLSPRHRIHDRDRQIVLSAPLPTDARPRKRRSPPQPDTSKARMRTTHRRLPSGIDRVHPHPTRFGRQAAELVSTPSHPRTPR